MHWFRPCGLLFLPASVIGWALSAGTLIFCAQIASAIDRQSHSVSDTLYGIFPFWVPALLALAWVADRTGGRAGSSR
ncbi:hypothetical protein [Sphingomonas astaxanthinifaciens]|uniref:Uncharacterized protein n=1 Tax=Sphingomonas astaxanthinifaciens DSM 22298 TaxID=1123267 RepID=A0ABQ5Z2Q7_9SPHN|nr:hypothetical protein [Sphingomonas astaxanthinifaciens]GLR46367.1 hypothetical protein GCM10007925_00780 [Sphingomonas astaxanthinifaciens DSM 22298]